MTDKKILVVIPARGGSKGIPRKNLRPLNGKPLIYYSVSNALNSKFDLHVYVSTEDDEIAFFSKKIGAEVLKRDNDLSSDLTTLDPVIINAYQQLVLSNGYDYDLVITMQPTSPLLKTSSLDNAIELMLKDHSIDTVISSINDSHLTWRNEDGKFKPNYLERVNRQHLPKEYKETGGFLISRPENFVCNTRIGKNITLYELTEEEAIDIDGFNDWALCNYYLKRKHILFVVSGYEEIGLGHIYNTLGLANEILDHKITFLVDKKSALGFQKIKDNNFDVLMQSYDDITNDIVEINPDIIINDKLDTSAAYIRFLKSRDYLVINIEDLGEGALHADLVINAIYPEEQLLPNHYFGPKYFCARDEFFYHPPKKINKNVTNVLLSFGGVDPCNLTQRVLNAIYDYCRIEGIRIDVITGLGYNDFHSLEKYEDINVHRDVKNISDFFFNADIVFSSAGRTVYELAALGTPTIVLAQNKRELTHFFAYEEFGFKNLGLGKSLEKETILDTFIDYANNSEDRKNMSKRMLDYEISQGKSKVVTLIYQLLNEN